jgi:RluA family pseudouridine synthase
VPYSNRRPLNVPQRFDGKGLLEFLCAFHPHIPESTWLEKIDAGHLLLEDEVLGPAHVVRGGQRIVHLVPGTIEPEVSSEIRILFEDEAIVVVNKPAPLPMHPSGRFNRNTLTWILGQVYKTPLRVAHRLDANTTGLVLFSRSLRIARRLQPQFERQQVVKRYLVRANGHLTEDWLTVSAPIADQPISGGGRLPGVDGRACVTDFTVLRRLDDGTTLLQATPRTGRTNQIRVHLWSIGHPVCGDPTYLIDKQLADTQTLSPGEPPMCLHAGFLQFQHPETALPFAISAPEPDWARLDPAPACSRR